MTSLPYRRNGAALWVYAALVVGTLGWAVWEIGFDWWQLAPRGGVIVLLALWLLTPWIRRPLAGQGTLALSVAVLAALAVAGYSMSVDPYDLAGSVGTEKIAGEPDLGGAVPPGEWHYYGRTQYGQRYSPLAQITTESIASLVPPDHRTGDVRNRMTPETTIR